MDSKRNTPRFKRWYFAAILLVAVAGLAGYYLSQDSTTRVPGGQLTVQTVTNDQFYEYINLTGRVIPEETYYVDSKVAGNVGRIYAESGQQVRRGDTLLFISNADLELEVMQRESQLIEQLNAQRQTRLLLNQNDFTRRDQLVEVDYQLRLREKQFARSTVLLADSLIARSDFEPTENGFAYYAQRRDLLQQAYRADSSARRSQLRQIADAEVRLVRNLGRVRAILDRRYVLAAADGRLSDFTVRGGQAIATGERLGEIYRLERPILVAEVDEFHLDRIYPDQPGLLLFGDDTVELAVRKVYPAVENGRFRIEVMALGVPTKYGTGAREWTKGQSKRIRLLFGTPKPSVLLASGNFYGSTGGRWVYRLLPDGRAERTPIQLGRANPDYYEVLEGLSPGDRVITSAYDGFQEYETIIIN